jgi:hypothetical protein
MKNAPRGGASSARTCGRAARERLAPRAAYFLAAEAVEAAAAAALSAFFCAALAALSALACAAAEALSALAWAAAAFFSSLALLAGAAGAAGAVGLAVAAGAGAGAGVAGLAAAVGAGAGVVALAGVAAAAGGRARHGGAVDGQAAGRQLDGVLVADALDAGDEIRPVLVGAFLAPVDDLGRDGGADALDRLEFGLGGGVRVGGKHRDGEEGEECGENAFDHGCVLGLTALCAQAGARRPVATPGMRRRWSLNACRDGRLTVLHESAICRERRLRLVVYPPVRG